MADGKRIPLFDIYEVTHLDMNDIEVFDTLQRGRVIWEVEASDNVYKLLREYHENPTVRLLDFVKALKKIRSRMLNLRDGNGRRENGQGDANGNRRDS